MDYAKKTKQELAKILFEKKKELRVFRFSITGTKIKNVKQGRMLRKEIARIMTALNAPSPSA
jgi:ribosomal protein L29